MHLSAIFLSILPLLASTSGQKLKLNYYSDHSCKNWKVRNISLNPHNLSPNFFPTLNLSYRAS
jgi:hypothetical protein